jgi:hypothetical protein
MTVFVASVDLFLPTYRSQIHNTKRNNKQNWSYRFFPPPSWDSSNDRYYHQFNTSGYIARKPHDILVSGNYMSAQTIIVMLLIMSEFHQWNGHYLAVPLGVRVMVFNATLNINSVMPLWSVVLVEETGENHQPAASH